ALSATYSKSFLQTRGYVDAVAKRIIVPVFGLYQGYANQVSLTYSFTDKSSKAAKVTVQTAQFDHPPFNNPNVIQARTTAQLSYDYILVASSNSNNSPTIIDTDGALRWVGFDGVQNHYCALYQNGIYHFAGTKLVRMELYGEVKVLADYASQGVVGFHHNIDPGKYGMIVDANTKSYVASVHFEVDAAGRILKKWNLAEIVRGAMIAGGDDPSGFVRKSNGNNSFASPSDWAHDNAVTYRKSDDSIIISSRENFVICIDYDTGAIKWILGDTTKAWYQYPSLRKYALTVPAGSIAPAGQHSVSITHDDHLLLLDNGTPSAHQTPAGVRRGYAAGRKYRLDLKARTATEVWTFDNNKSVLSAFRSSIYEDDAFNYLVDYAVARNPDGSTRAEILGLSASGQKVFDYSYPSPMGFVAYRSIPIHLENLAFPFRTDGQLANISARAEVKTGDNVGIAGFVVSGAAPKKLVFRGLGPSLQVNGQPVAGRLMDPEIELFDSSSQRLQLNDNYKDGAAAAEITQAGLAPTDDREAAIAMQLAPGDYTVILRGVNQTTGIGLVEIFDISPAADARLANLSARAFSSTGDKVLISGVILGGNMSTRLMFRALGPELKAQGVADAEDDTLLTLFDAEGTKIAANDDWGQALNAAEIEATGIAPRDSRESAILMQAVSGTYTCVAGGKSDGGVVLLEVYQFD
ncbi:MAG: aryl-sulfate sulfotransferase, partial [Pyrinomonadaceae bacterium]|nr:aryl-sulfate sulfotransferase [Pyrinomonadaceae bacterium]